MTTDFCPLEPRYIPGLYELYRTCFPRLLAQEEEWARCLAFENGSLVLLSGEPEQPEAACVLNGRSVLLLCVAPGSRGRGLGNALLHRAEEQIAAAGHGRVILGHDSGPYLFQGAPCEGPEQAPAFFIHRGYTARWTSLDLMMRLAGYRTQRPILSAAPENVTYGPVRPDEGETLLAAVARVDPGWVQFYSIQPQVTWVARADGEIIGFTLAENSVPLGAGLPGPAGGPACVGVVPQWRERGVGLALVAAVTDELARRGLAYSYVGYTWMEQWYGRLGYRPYQYYWMGEKAL